MESTTANPIKRTETHDMNGNLIWYVDEATVAWPPVDLFDRRFDKTRPTSEAKKLHRDGYRYVSGYIAKDGSRRALLTKITFPDGRVVE